MGSSSPPARLTARSLAAGVEALSACDPDLGAAIQRHGAPPMWGRRAGFATLLRIVLEQQVSLASADATYRKLSRRVGRVTPGAVLALSDNDLRRVGFSRQKTRYGRELANAFVERRLDPRALERMSDEAVIHALTAVPGIGAWTASIFLLMALRRPDVWPPGDLALAKSAQRVKALPALPDDKALMAISEGWRPWRAVAARILWHAYLRERR